mmetsp:Transcript_41796/g.97868  ORF Transcript_41796/g.97868 Transcript_41796/m.97868 type:complete len:324 (+) Transcript_41796:777-1748(+)
MIKDALAVRPHRFEFQRSQRFVLDLVDPARHAAFFVPVRILLIVHLSGGRVGQHPQPPAALRHAQKFQRDVDGKRPLPGLNPHGRLGIVHGERSERSLMFQRHGSQNDVAHRSVTPLQLRNHAEHLRSRRDGIVDPQASPLQSHHGRSYGNIHVYDALDLIQGPNFVRNDGRLHGQTGSISAREGKKTEGDATQRPVGRRRGRCSCGAGSRSRGDRRSSGGSRSRGEAGQGEQDGGRDGRFAQKIPTRTISVVFLFRWDGTQMNVGPSDPSGRTKLRKIRPYRGPGGRNESTCRSENNEHRTERDHRARFPKGGDGGTVWPPS